MPLPDLLIHPDGKVDAISNPEVTPGNAHLVCIDGEPFAVRADLVRDKGWQPWSAVEVAQRVAGMPKV